MRGDILKKLKKILITLLVIILFTIGGLIVESIFNNSNKKSICQVFALPHFWLFSFVSCGIPIMRKRLTLRKAYYYTYEYPKHRLI